MSRIAMPPRIAFDFVVGFVYLSLIPCFSFSLSLIVLQASPFVNTLSVFARLSPQLTAFVNVMIFQ